MGDATTTTRRRLSDAGWAALVTVLTFPSFLVDVGTGLDYSWAAGLHMAAHRGFEFGRDIVFTFGPLGFLTAPAMYYPFQGTLALLLRLPLLFAIALLAVRQARRVLPLIPAVAAAVPLVWAAGSTVLPGGEAPMLPVALAAAGGTWLLLRPAGATTPDWAWAAGGGAAALLLLCKFDAGLALLALVGLAAVLDGLGRDVTGRAVAVRTGALLGGFVAVLVAAWVVLGQPVGGLGRWLRTSWSIFSGYNDAMAVTTGAAWEATAAAVAVGGVALLLVPHLRPLPRRRAVCVTAFVTVAVYVFAKQAFTRHDSGHVLRLSSALVLVALVLVKRETLATFALTAGMAVVLAVSLAGKGPAPFLHPGRSIDMVQRVAELAFSSAERRAVIAWGRQAIPVVYPVPESMVRRIDGHTVHMEPWEAVNAWVYPRWRWRPLPVFQSYSAYTGDLDRRNARAYDRADAPRFVLLEHTAIDDRIPRWESPAAMTRFLCRYRIVETSDRWQLFERRPGAGACGAAQPLSRTRARFGEAVTVPAAGPSELVVARFSGVEPSLPTRLRGLVLRRRATYAVVGDDPVAHRFVRATAGSPHVVALPACLQGQLGTFDTRTFPTLTLTGQKPVPGRALTPGRSYTVTFERIPYAC